MDELEKVDEIRRRTGVGYREAREALARADGDLLQALIYLEDSDGGDRWAERIQVSGSELVDKVRELIREGNVRRVKVRHNDRTLLEFPVTVGALGALLLPTLAALGAIAAMVTECTVVVEREAEGADDGDEGDGMRDGCDDATPEDNQER
ncbi:MAG: DUF4342 domain-containing protein [Bacillota bacterium]